MLDDAHLRILLTDEWDRRALLSVVLDPDLINAQVDVDDDAVDAAPPLPPNVEEFEVAPRLVGDELGLDLTLGRREGCVLFEDGADDRAVRRRATRSIAPPWCRCGIGVPTIDNRGRPCRAADAVTALVTPARCAGSPRGRRA